jgi:hypothetical protein
LVTKSKSNLLSPSQTQTSRRLSHNARLKRVTDKDSSLVILRKTAAPLGWVYY